MAYSLGLRELYDHIRCLAWNDICNDDRPVAQYVEYDSASQRRSALLDNLENAMFATHNILLKT